MQNANCLCYPKYMENDFVDFDRNSLKITVRLEGRKDLVIDKNSVDISYFSGSPGGQNANRNLNGVRLIYHIPDEYRMHAMRTQQIVTRVIGKRSMHYNMQAAFDQLARKIQQYFYVPPVRKKTKKPKRAKEKRLRNKKVQSQKKQDRRKVEF